MVLDCEIDVQWANEVKYIFDHVYHKFEVAYDTLEEAQKKVESFIYSLWSSSEETRQSILQKITPTEWHDLIDALEKCIEDFDKYLSLISSGLESFKTLICLSPGNVDEMFLEITENVVELFISVQIGIVDQMKEIQEIIEKFGVLPPLEES